MPKSHRSVEPTAETLAAVELFAELSPAARGEVARLCHAGLFDAHEEILSHREHSSDVYFVASGRVRATIYSLSGKEVTFRDIEAGSPFGDLAAIDGEPRSANVVTLTDSLLVWMSASDFWRVLDEHRPASAALLRALTGQIRRLSERVVEFSTLGAKNRLHAELLRLARDHPSGDNEAEIAPAPTHADIASRISSHREAVSREMQRLADAGLIERRPGRLLIHDLDRLAAMVKEVKGA